MNSFIGYINHMSLMVLLLCAVVVVLLYVLFKEYIRLTGVWGASIEDHKYTRRVRLGLTYVGVLMMFLALIKGFALLYMAVYNYGAQKEIEGAAKVVVQEIYKPRPQPKAEVEKQVDQDLFKFCIDSAKGNGRVTLSAETITACKDAAMGK